MLKRVIRATSSSNPYGHSTVLLGRRLAKAAGWAGPSVHREPLSVCASVVPWQLSVTESVPATTNEATSFPKHCIPLLLAIPSPGSNDFMKMSENPITLTRSPTQTVWPKQSLVSNGAPYKPVIPTIQPTFATEQHTLDGHCQVMAGRRQPEPVREMVLTTPMRRAQLCIESRPAPTRVGV
jgi:hypothetical protein